MSDREEDKRLLRDAWEQLFRSVPVPADQFLGGWLGQAFRRGFAQDPAGCVIGAFEVAAEAWQGHWSEKKLGKYIFRLLTTVEIAGADAPVHDIPRTEPTIRVARFDEDGRPA